MTQRNNDDIANALHGLASGEHGEPDSHDEHGTGQAHYVEQLSPPVPQTAPAPPPPGPSSARPTTAPMRPRPQPQPQPPGYAPRPAAPTAPSGLVRPPSPVQPGGVVSRSATPSGNAASAATGSSWAPPPTRSAPVAPAPPAAPANAGFVVDDLETTNVQPVDEDDRVVVPAAPLSALGHQSRHRPAVKRVPMFKTLQFRRTAIPILLTTGAMLLAVVGLKFIVHPDSALATLPGGTLLGLVAVAGVLLSVAALNMAQVRRQLGSEKPKK